jgi:tyrosinase
MLDPIASPGDPIFYLHHTWLDKVFWEWQALNLTTGLTDIGGSTLQMIPGTDGTPPSFVIPGQGPGGPPDTTPSDPPIIIPNPDQFPPPGALAPNPALPLQFPAGDPGNVTTLGHILNMFGIIPNATIADVMDIGGPLLCYTYV